MPVNFPYGDAFLVKTPNIDETARRLYAERKQIEANRQQQIAAMDNEFSKNVANIRDADVGEVAKAYGNWKMATQNAMKKKGGISPQEQLEILRKKADMYKMIGDSKAEKENEETRAKRYVIKPDDFIDNAGDLMTTGRKLPLSQLRAYKTPDGSVIDLTNPENLLYQDKTNWQPILQKAGGTLMQRGTQLEEDTPDKLQKKVTSFKALNSPIEYYNSIVGTFSNAKADENFAKRYGFTPQEAQTITEEYNRVLKDNPAMKQVYGDLSFPSTADLLPGHQTAKLLAMQHAIHNQPTSSVTMKDNKDAIMTRQENFRKDQQERSNQNSIKRLYIWAGLQRDKPMSPNEVAMGIDGLITNHIKSAESNGGELLVDAETYKAITGQPQTRNSYLTVDQSGNYAYGRKVENKDGMLEVDKTTLKEVPYQLTKSKLTEAYPKTRPVPAQQTNKPIQNKNKWEQYKSN